MNLQKHTLSLSVDLIRDLHLDRWPGIEMRYVPNPGITIAIVPGDLHRNPEMTGKELRKIRAAYETVLFLDGNNEFRDAFLTAGNFKISDTENELRREIAAINADFGGGVHYLKDGPLIIDGVAFAGRNGHWDHAVDTRITVQEALKLHQALLDNILNPKVDESKLTDAQKKDIEEQRAKQKFAAVAPPPQGRGAPVTLDEAASCMEQGLKDVAELGNEIRHLSETRDVQRIVLVTHTVPHIPGTDLLDFGNGKWTPHVMSIMGNSRLKDLATKAFDPNGKASHHLFGHQHDRRDVVINGVRYVGNPCGNPGQIYAPGMLLDYRPQTIVIGQDQAPSAPPRVVISPDA